MTTTVEEKRETFTPGPWKIKNGKNYYHIHGGQEVALVENWMNETPRANARLIAAAPEMAEALREILAECGDVPAGLSEAALGVIAIRAHNALRAGGVA